MDYVSIYPNVLLKLNVMLLLCMATMNAVGFLETLCTNGIHFTVNTGHVTSVHAIAVTRH